MPKPEIVSGETADRQKKDAAAETPAEAPAEDNTADNAATRNHPQD